MRAIVSLLFVTLVMFVCMPQDAFSQTYDKEIMKAAKTMAKKMKKEGKIIISSLPPEMLLAKHITKINGQEELVRIATASHCKTQNIGSKAAIISAQSDYATLISGEIQGVATSAMTHADIPQEQVDETNAIFKSEISTNVSGILVPSYSYYKNNSDGTIDYTTVFIIDKAKEKQMVESTVARVVKKAKLTAEAIDEIKTKIKGVIGE